MNRGFARIGIPVAAALLVLLVFAGIAHNVLASEHIDQQYEGGLVPENCRGTNSGNNCPCRLCDLYQLGLNIMNFLMQAVAIPIVTVMLAWGGIKMMTSAGNPNAIGEGKKIITNAVVGLFLAFFGWILIDTILTTLSFGFNASNFGAWYNKPNACQEASGSCTPDIDQTPRDAGGGGGGGGGGAGGGGGGGAQYGCQDLAEDGVIRGRLLDKGVRVNSMPNTTCLDCLPETAINKLIAAQQACADLGGSMGCIKVTGGTESGHRSHMCGQATVDIEYSQLAFQALQQIGMQEDTTSPYFSSGKITCEKCTGSHPCNGIRVVCGPGAQWMHTEF